MYDNNIKEFRENPHKKQKNDALESDDIEVVRAHHKKMEERIREYYRGGDADSLNVGVIVPIDTYLQQYLSRSTPQFSNIQTPPAAQSTSITQLPSQSKFSAGPEPPHTPQSSNSAVPPHIPAQSSTLPSQSQAP